MEKNGSFRKNIQTTPSFSRSAYSTRERSCLHFISADLPWANHPREFSEATKEYRLKPHWCSANSFHPRLPFVINTPHLAQQWVYDRSSIFGSRTWVYPQETSPGTAIAKYAKVQLLMAYRSDLATEQHRSYSFYITKTEGVPELLACRDGTWW